MESVVQSRPKNANELRAGRPRTDRVSRLLRVATFSTQRLVGASAIALIIAASVLVLIWLLARPLALFALGIALAAALSPLVASVQRRLSRTLSVIVVYLGLCLIAAGIIATIAPQLVGQIRDISTRGPELMKQSQHLLNRWLNGDVLDILRPYLNTLGTKLVALPLLLAESVLDFVFVLFISIYWLLQGPAMRRFGLSLFPESRRQRADEVLQNMGDAMGGYIRGVAIGGLIVAMLTFIGLLIIGVEYALMLALCAGMLEIIPVIGPIIATVPMTAMAFLQSPTKAMIVVVFMIILQQIESNILTPNIMRSQTAISPLLVILALMAGGTLGGILGALVAIPLAAALRVFVLEVIVPAVRRRNSPMSEKSHNT